MSSQESPLDPEEPQTPTWFTILGIALFLFGGIFALIASSGEDEEASSAAATAENAQPDTNPAAVPQPNAAPAQAPAADPHAGHGH